MEEHALVFIGRGCSCDCRFCTRSRGTLGPDATTAATANLPMARAVTIQAGDLIDPDLVPVVARLRSQGTREIFVYAHPACRNVEPLRELAAAGLTGVMVMVPASDRTAMQALCGPEARLERLALLLKAAVSLDLKISVEMPVLEENFTDLPATFERLLKLTGGLTAISLPFRAIHDGDGLNGWNFGKAADKVAEVVSLARHARIPVILGGSEGPAPCVIDLQDAAVEEYPGLDNPPRPVRNRNPALGAACRRCSISDTCDMTMNAWAGDLPTPILNPRTGAASELFWRRASIERLLTQAAGIERCDAPWTSLEVHDRTGRVSPCEGSWPKREMLGTPDGTDRGWLTAGILDSFNAGAMIRMRQAMVAGGRLAACNKHCPMFFETWAGRPPLRMPRTSVFFDNLAACLEGYIRGDDVVAFRPLNITVSPSLRCNQRCRMCDLTDDDAGPTGVETPDWLLDELETLLPTTATLSLTGGEPLTSRRTVDLLATITPERLPDTSYTMTTNGTLLTPAVITRLAGSSMAGIFISVNAASQATHEVVTGVRNNFDKVLSNVATMVYAARGMPRHPAVTMSFVVMQSNLSELEAFIELAGRLGTLIRLLPVERNRQDESLFTDPERIEKAETVVRKLRERYMHLWPHAALELERLHRVIRLKMEDVGAL